MKITIGCSGFAKPATGIGVVQKALYSRLERDFGRLVKSPRRDIGESSLTRVVGLIKGLLPPVGGYDVYLSTTPPLPMALRRPTVAIVHDLRWQRTKGRLGRLYRQWDLYRTVRLSTRIICISERTRRDLVEMFPTAAPKSTVAWLGRGLLENVAMSDSGSGVLLLMGGAPHKRNEEAARLLASARPAWLRGIVGIGVSTTVQNIVDEAFGPTFAIWHKGLSDAEVVAEYENAEYFMLLSTDEGFGMPFVEGLAAGCQVIVRDHELVRELLGSACIYLTNDDKENRLRLQSEPQIDRATRQVALSRFSWDSFYNAVQSALISSCGGNPDSRVLGKSSVHEGLG